MGRYAHGRSLLLNDPDSVELSKEEEEVLSSQSYLLLLLSLSLSVLCHLLTFWVADLELIGTCTLIGDY